MAEFRARRAEERSVVIACSALKRRYRDLLREAAPDLLLVYLRIDPEAAKARAADRHAHFMPAGLIANQFAILEPPTPDEAPLVIDSGTPINAAVERVIDALANKKLGER